MLVFDLAGGSLLVGGALGGAAKVGGKPLSIDSLRRGEGLTSVAGLIVRAGSARGTECCTRGYKGVIDHDINVAPLVRFHISVPATTRSAPRTGWVGETLRSLILPSIGWAIVCWIVNFDGCSTVDASGYGPSLLLPDILRFRGGLSALGRIQKTFDIDIIWPLGTGGHTGLLVFG